MEIESRLLPCGLHVVGEPPSAMEAIATLVNIAEIDRPDLEKPIRGLPGILARSIRRNVEQIYQANNKVSHSTPMSSRLPEAADYQHRVHALVIFYANGILLDLSIEELPSLCNPSLKKRTHDVYLHSHHHLPKQLHSEVCLPPAQRVQLLSGQVQVDAFGVEAHNILHTLCIAFLR